MPQQRNEQGVFQKAPKRYDAILHYPSIQRWNLVLRSPKTKDMYFGTMYAFLESDTARQFQIDTPDDLLTLYDQDMAQAVQNRSFVSAPRRIVDVILDFRESYRQQGKLRMGEMVKTVFKSFYSANDRELRSRNLRVVKIPKTQQHHQRLIPTKRDVYRLVDHAWNARDKAAILVLWQSGLRNSTMRNLTIGDVRQGLVRGDVPLRISITPQIDKASLREPYYTFIDVDGVTTLQKYLERRGALTELPADEPLFLSNRKGVKHQLSENGLNRLIKRAAKRAGYDSKSIYAHCFRTSFYNQLIGKTDDTVREFLFGHSLAGSRQAYFNPKRVEAIKEEYMKGEWSPSDLEDDVEDLKQQLEEERTRREALSQQLKEQGDRFLNWLKERDVTWKVHEMGKEIRAQQYELSTVIEEKDKYHVKIIAKTDESLYIQLLEQGWEHYKEFNGKIVLRLSRASE